jgi:RNA 3'-terminal phosphate cyclase (ATP)
VSSWRLRVIEVDGSLGEGGGQVLRTSLALSLALGRPFRMVRIRAGRPRPGLQRQHLAAVRAAATIGDADTGGAQLGSSTLVFEPTACTAGRYHFDIGSAGSATLVAQTVLPALARCDAPSHVRVTGGTHNRAAPPYEFLAHSYLPLVSRAGLPAEVRLRRHGFEPAGGGELHLDVHGGASLLPLDLSQRGVIRRRVGRAVVARLPRHIAERELALVVDRLAWRPDELTVEVVEADGPGNVLLLEVVADEVVEVFTGFGVRGKPAEAVAREAATAAERYLATDVPVGEHLADQLLVPLALGAGGRFVTVPPTAHFTTNAEVLRHFLDVEVSVVPLSGSQVRVEVRPGPS